MPLSSPTMVAPRKGSYRSDLFDASALTSLDAVECAAFEFQAIVNAGNVERILNDLMAHEAPDVLRLVVSCLDEDLILSRFPTTPEGFAGSLAQKILSVLSLFFMFAQHVPALHSNHQGLVKEAPDLISAIAAKLAAAEHEPVTATGGKKSQKKMKTARRIANQGKNTLESTPFEHLNIPVPESPEELEKSLEIVLATQRSILEAYLASLRIPTVAAAVKATFLVTEENSAADPEDATEDNAAGDELNHDLQPVRDTQDVYLPVQSISFSTLYRRRAVGFGDWEINIAARAERDLREYSRRDRKVFLLIVKKMRDLSTGDFSPDNHSEINGGEIEVPIYEAKVTEDLRVVYQVDCVPIYHSKSEQQTLKIFGVYQDAQLTRGTFWNSMSRELGKRGKEYKDRCAQRRSGEGHFFVPVNFPAREEVRLNRGTVPDLPSDDAEQIQTLLLKTVHFSQELLNDILANRDVVFALNMSPRELEIIEHKDSCYVLGRSGTGKTTTMLYRMLLREVSSDPMAPKIRQVFVTQSRILADKVGEYFSKLLGGYRPSAIPENVKAAKRADKALIRREDDEWRSDLPKKYSDLQDTDFPLFVAFDQLCAMLECDMLANNGAPVGKPTLTYEKFQRDYWPHFPQSLSKGLDAAMVFSEWMGVIKGSEETLTSKSYYLDREDYLNLSERRQSTFSDQRARIYDLFERYLTQKTLDSDTDAADRTHAILKSIQNHDVPGRRIDYLYVDETQDNLLIDTLVLRCLCRNPNGLFWAGDTAQTISVGSSFRFNELRAFLFRIEGQRQKKHPEMAFISPVAPTMFQLSVNYRSHSGIVNCARSIIEVITTLWPNAIDSLDPEEGTVDGLRPIFFANWDADNVEAKQFLFGDPSEGSIEFGAQQCILVRDAAAKEKLRKLVGEIGIILTLYESKGLEFNDVLLYNFFEDSGVSEAQWRVVLNLIENGPPAPGLDSVRHGSVCAELKFLYVAITRARNNIWIADCSTKGEPIRTLWTSRNQVENSTLGSDTPRFAISSTREEWQEQGQKLFDRNQFSQAKFCFERAYMPHEAAVSQAYYLYEEADAMPRSDHRREIAARKAAFLRAAVAFMECAPETKTVEAYLLTAGKCFVRAGDLSRAIAAYQRAQHFGRVAELYRQMGDFDAAIATIRDHSGTIDTDVVERIKGVARLFYFKKGQLEMATQLFDKQEDALEYLDERGLHGERATVLESFARLSDAAEIHLTNGRTLDAIALFLRDQNTERASDCILQGLWEILSFSVLPDAQGPLISKFLHFASQVDVSGISQSKRDQIAMFQAIANRENSKLQSLAQSFHRSHDQPAALLCLDHRFRVIPKIPALPVDALAGFLEFFLVYVKLLYHVAFNLDPCNSSAASKLFGYRKANENYVIPQGTFIRLGFPTRSAEETILLSGPELREVLHRLLKEHLNRKTMEEDEMCLRTPAFAGPCLTFTSFNSPCNRDDCPQEHIFTPTFGPLDYRLRVRIHLQQILIHNHLIRVDVPQRNEWLSRLYVVLHPAFYQLGSAANLDLRGIPEFPSGLQIVKEWVRGSVYTLGFIPDSDFLTRMVQLANLGFQFDGTHAMEYLTHGAFMMDPRKPLKYRRPPEGQYIVAEFLFSLQNHDDSCLSAGIYFLHRVATTKQSIHINELFDVAESLCAGLVIADRLRFGRLHDVTLPLSWLVNRTSVAGGLSSLRDISAVWLFAEALAELLEPIYSGSGAEHLLFENINFSYKSLDHTIRSIFLARLCRCLCLLAYNFRSWELREYVWNSITWLWRRNTGRLFTSLCSRYVRANSWAGLAAAVRSSTKSSTLDEMVQLLHNSRNPPRAVSDVRQIVYGEVADIPRLLGSARLHTRPESQTHEGTTAVAEESLDEAGDDVLEETDANESLPKDVTIHMPAMSDPEPLSPKELEQAAKIYRFILLAHGRVEQRKKETSKFLFTPALVELFVACKAQSLTMASAHRLYRDYFLGPLPHLLLCLDIVHGLAQKEAVQIKKELRSAEHETLENLDKKLTDVQRTLKQVIKIQGALQPAAEVHANRNLVELKDWARQAVALLQALPFGTPPDMQRHLGIAHKGILKAPERTVTRRKELKPALNTEEEMF
ncbi:hypothetical protein C8R46DRAFT_1357916 [Mycena filopes]|nr:hypothetical protein C8R46DRAFT_1357916 [Mycena filopes]